MQFGGLTDGKLYRGRILAFGAPFSGNITPTDQTLWTSPPHQAQI
jgi:hypothetical protein